MPALPFFHGMMNIGDGPEIILSATANAVHKRMHPGESIGEFLLVAFNADDVEFEWNGKRIIKPLAEISGHGAGPPGAEPSQAEAAAPPPRVEPTPASYGPGVENAIGERSCVPGDTSPEGTEKDGVVKTLIKSPLIPGVVNCIWKPKGR
jgi:hypothetical protein